MCAHYESVQSGQRLTLHFGVEPPAEAATDVWPGYLSTFIRSDQPPTQAHPPAAKREALLGAFGLIPHWSKDATIAKRTYNARSETVATKPSYRDAWRLGRRCVIPAEAFYEPDWRSGRAVPTRIARADGHPMGIAGIWTGWRSPNGAIVRSMSMLTVNADDHPLMRHFHRPDDEKRMVVILDEADYDTWLFGDHAAAWDLIGQFPAERLTT